MGFRWQRLSVLRPRDRGLDPEKAPLEVSGAQFPRGKSIRQRSLRIVGLLWVPWFPPTGKVDTVVGYVIRAHMAYAVLMTIPLWQSRVNKQTNIGITYCFVFPRT